MPSHIVLSPFRAIARFLNWGAARNAPVWRVITAALIAGAAVFGLSLLVSSTIIEIITH